MSLSIIQILHIIFLSNDFIPKRLLYTKHFVMSYSIYIVNTYLIASESVHFYRRQ